MAPAIFLKVILTDAKNGETRCAMVVEFVLRAQRVAAAGQGLVP